MNSIIVAPNGKPAALELLRNQFYEGSKFSRNRSIILQPLQEAHKDLDRFTRAELCKSARYLYKNSPLIRGIVERLVTLTIGGGFHPIFKSSDPAWNERAKLVWKNKSRNVSLGAKSSMLQYQRSVARARFVDGECFSIKTSDDHVTYEDRLQGVESERVVGGVSSDVKSPLVDGFNLNSQGTVKSYNIKGSPSPYLAENVIHHFTPTRLGQYRGETILSAAINTARDVDDILALEKAAVKEASGKTDVIKTTSGTLDPEAFRTIRYGQSGDMFGLQADDSGSKTDYYLAQFGAKPIVMKKGDEYTPYQSSRPGSAWQGFMDFLGMTICLSTSMPPSITVPMSVGGTDIRRDLDIAQRVVDPWQLDLAAEFDECLEYLLEMEVIDGPLSNPPKDYKLRCWKFPQKINVDRQQAQQDREDVMHGLMSLEEYHGRWSENATEVEATILSEVTARRNSIVSAGFKDVQEFVQYLSLDARSFMNQQNQQATDTQKHAT